jgi:hypothetical protein
MHNEAKKFTKAARSDGGNAFIRDPEGGPAHTKVEEAEAMAEHYVASALGGGDSELDDADDDENQHEEEASQRLRLLFPI